MEFLIGFGGNLGDPPAAFERALAALAIHGSVKLRSSVRRTDPIGPPQPRYWNMAAVVEFSGSALELLELCQDIEAAAGRRRDSNDQWGPRTLDLDLLLAPGLVCCGPRLTLPHPRFHERLFALAPAAELVPDWLHPLQGFTVRELRDRT